MLMTTTPTIQGKNIRHYRGIVTGVAIVGANIFKDFLAGIRDIVGGRSAAYEAELGRAREVALQEMVDAARRQGSNAVVGIDLRLRSRRTRRQHAHGLRQRHRRHLRLKLRPCRPRPNPSVAAVYPSTFAVPSPAPSMTILRRTGLKGTELAPRALLRTDTLIRPASGAQGADPLL